ncbi:hypothetical protein [Methylocystis sp.]|uniref:hypothetical protein n=1 Tax=Methylocystis sp. TaxID=1911079 RepID=UPI003D0AE45E
MRNSVAGVAFAALAAGLMWCAERALRAGNTSITIAGRKGVAAPLAAAGAKLCLAVSTALLRATEAAREVALNDSRA